MKPIVLIFDHLLEGRDIPTGEAILKLSAKSAAVKLESAPYSILTNVAHARLWQDHWLAQLQGTPRMSSMELWTADFQVPETTDWNEIRTEFLAGLHTARALAAAEPFAHHCASDEHALDLLARIAVHGAYHLGQLNLLKRQLRQKKNE